MKLLYMIPLTPVVLLALCLGFVINSTVQGFRKGWKLADKY